MSFLPVTNKEMHARGWEQADFILVSGDAYVDHPSFGHAIIGRTLEAYGYKVAVLAQPQWKNAEDFKRFGRPRLGFLITAGNVDSMVNHYTVWKKRRKKDAYSPGGQTGKRPDRALIQYSKCAKEAYADVPIILGGLEASLRRFGHYDYWDETIRKSILIEADADLLVFGMAEKTVVTIAEALHAGLDVQYVTWIRGTVYRKTMPDTGRIPLDYQEEPVGVLPSFQAICRDKREYARSFAMQYQNSDPFTGKKLIEPYGKDTYVIQNPPAEPLSTEELDHIYEYPYENAPHPIYEKMGGVPAVEEIKFSIAASRGCFGGCAFCALTYHQGRIVQGRSEESIVLEAQKIITMPGFKGYLHDVGGPTANFRQAACAKQEKTGCCPDRDCLYPKACANLVVDHSEYLRILRRLRGLPGVKKVFIRSGVRFDYAMYDRDDQFIREVCEFHVSGVLKVAPEHVSPRVLARMRKPDSQIFEQFCRKYEEISKKLGRRQYIIPYFISSHPGSRLADAVELAEYLKKRRFIPDQVQDFYPTPGTLATCMYHTGIDPLTGEQVYVPRSLEERKMQRALLHFHKPENADMVRQALTAAGREDLIGCGKNCLVPARSKGQR